MILMAPPQNRLFANKIIVPFLVIVLAQVAGSFFATIWLSGIERSALFLAAFPTITMLLCASGGWRSRFRLLVVMAATLTSMAAIQGLRKSLDPDLFFGPCPPGWELPGYGVLALITLVCAAWPQLLLRLQAIGPRLRWTIVATSAFGLISLAALLVNFSKGRALAPQLLFAITQLEQQAPLDSGHSQELSILLAQAGRASDAESVSRWMHSDGASQKVHSNSPPIDLSKLKPLPWRETMTRIAHQHQLIIVMEAHNAPGHRQWIEQLLSIVKEAGFEDYAAEGLAESGVTLKQRGYPLPTTGYYVVEPHFANLLRRAIDLDFTLHRYESNQRTMELRESDQAAKLAQLFAANPKRKLLVHAGYGHLFKTHRPNELKMMAAHLWETTGIEPFCIWQIFHSPEEADAHLLAGLLRPQAEPVMLAPVPGGLKDIQFRFSPGSVDALVVHPPSTGGAGQRVHGFPSMRKRVAGTWQGLQWPVLIGAYKKEEPANAIALDQVMLRFGEREFALWVPTDDYELRAFGIAGPMPSAMADGLIRLDLEAQIGR